MALHEALAVAGFAIHRGEEFDTFVVIYAGRPYKLELEAL